VLEKTSEARGTLNQPPDPFNFLYTDFKHLEQTVYQNVYYMLMLADCEFNC